MTVESLGVLICLSRGWDCHKSAEVGFLNAAEAGEDYKRKTPLAKKAAMYAALISQLKPVFSVLNSINIGGRLGTDPTLVLNGIEYIGLIGTATGVFDKVPAEKQ